MAFEVVVFIKPKEHGVASKRLSLVNGKVVSDSSECRLWDGNARVDQVQGLEGFAVLINGLSSQEFITLGSIKEEFRPSAGKSIRVVSKAIYAALENKTGVITRTRAYVEFPAGEGPMLLDFDFKGMPVDARKQLEAQGGPWEFLVGLFPALARAAHIKRSSTSSGLYHTKTGEKFPHSGGMHVYLIVADARDIPRATKAIFDTLWANDFGWSFVSEGGAVLARGPVDASVALPEHPVFEGAPLIVPPLAQKKSRQAVAFDGEITDTRTAFPDPPAKVRQRAERSRAEWRARLKPEAEKVQKAQTEARIEKVVRKAKANNQPPPDREQLRRELSLAYHENSRLAPDFELEFDDPAIGIATVAEVLSDRARFVGQTLADPLEGVAYGRCKALVMEDNFSGGLFIKSFAHGGMGYRLVLNEAMIAAMIEAAAPKDAVRIFLEAMKIGGNGLFPGATENLADLCAKRSKTTTRKQALMMLKAQRDADAKERADAAQAAMDNADGRVLLKAPGRDAEVDAVCREIDDILSRSPMAPMRDRNGRLVEIAESSFPGLHRLSLNDDDKNPAPAPPEPFIQCVTGVGVAMLVEGHIRFRHRRNRYVALPPPFWEGLNRLPLSKLPVLTGVQTLPIFRPRHDGSLVILKENGLDRQTGFFFKIAAEVLAAIPVPENVAEADAKAAYNFLANEWLVDVDTDAAGKAVLIAQALTFIERLLLETERPAFLIDAPLAGTGKTTAQHMLATAVFGRPASAAAWSPSPEERRKALFSYLRAAVPSITWDNIPQGARLDCNHINASLTSATMEDRILGTQTHAVVATTVVQSFTGNNIAAVGDLRTRTLTVRLNADQENPANRDFRHPDPLSWTFDNRPKILRALFVVLCTPRGLPNRLKTRMKLWWKLIGHPVELLSGVCFETIIAGNAANDPLRTAKAFILHVLHERFSYRSFTAQEVELALDGPQDFNDEEYLKALPKLDSQTATRFRESLADLAGPASGAPSRGAFRDGFDARKIGLRLASIQDAPVDLKELTLTLRREKRRDLNANAYWIDPGV